MKPFFNTQEVANILGISSRTVARQVKLGKIKVEKHKGKLRYPAEQFEDIRQETSDNAKALVMALQKQIETLTKEIDIKNQQIEKLQITITNQQALTKELGDKVLQLPPPKEKRGFLSGLFQ